MEKNKNQIVNLDEVLNDFFILSQKVMNLNGDENVRVKQVEAWGGSAHVRLSKKDCGKYVKIIIIPEDEVSRIKDKIETQLNSRDVLGGEDRK